MKGRTKQTPSTREKFLEWLSQTANVTLSCAKAGVARASIYEWRHADPAFRDAWDAAVDLGTEALEDEVIRRAMEGVEKPVFYQGAPCGAVREFSDTLLIFALKARKPDKYRERADVNVNVTHSLVDRLDGAIARIGHASGAEEETRH